MAKECDSIRLLLNITIVVTSNGYAVNKQPDPIPNEMFAFDVFVTAPCGVGCVLLLHLPLFYDLLDVGIFG